MRARAFILRVVVAVVAVGLLVGAVVGARAALSTTGPQEPLAQALAPVAVDGSISSDPGAVPVNAPAPVSAPLPPQNAVLPGTPAAILPQPTSAAQPSEIVVPTPSRVSAPQPTPVARGSAVPAGLSPYSAWAAALAKSIDVPARALQAYGNAQNIVAREQPGCHLSWTTLAGIAHIESNHGRFGGRTLQSDGRPSSPIIGIPLDGGPSVQAIRDTDGGVLDGDTQWDRAVGPFQFIPTTWAKWRADGNGDRIADPQNIDDAALAAGRYLCASGRDLSQGANWWQAILSYNNSTSYVQDVFNGADSYARAALR